MKAITVLLADDHAIVRDSLLAILKLEPDIVVCALARNGRDAVRLAAQHRPDVILMDVAMPGLNGVEATRQIRVENHRAKVIVLSAHNERGYVYRAIREGALGYVLKHASAEMLGCAIREVFKGNAYFSPSVARQVAAYCHEVASAGCSIALPMEGLTLRESEVVQLIAESYSTKQIAAELGISAKTVEKHRQRLMEKVGIHNVAGLTRYAIMHGVVEQAEPPDVAHDCA